MPDSPLAFLSYPVEGDTDWYDDLEVWMDRIEALGIPTYEDSTDFPTPPDTSTVTDGARNQSQFAASVADRTIYRWNTVDSTWDVWLGAGTETDPHPDFWTEELVGADVANAGDGEVVASDGDGTMSILPYLTRDIERVAYEPGLVSYDSGLPWTPVHRFKGRLGATTSRNNASFFFNRLEFITNSGTSSSSDAGFRVVDGSDDTVVETVDLGGTDYVPTEVTGGVDIRLEVRNETGSTIEAAPICRGYLIAQDYL